MLEHSSRAGAFLASLATLFAVAIGVANAQGPAGSADLSITKTDSADPIQAGSNLTYTIKVSNFGPDAATGVVVTDKLPSGTDYVSATSTQGACDIKGRNLTCTVGDLTADATDPYEAGSSATITLVVKAPKKAGNISNTAEVTGATGDPVAANNSATQTTRVVEGGGGGGSASCGGETPTIVGTSGPDVLKGTTGRDVILARGGADQVNGVGGRDLICAGAGKDEVKGGGGGDRIFGAGGRDRLSGQGGNDKVRGQARGDRLRGGSGDDSLSGGPGNDGCSGGAGKDQTRSC